MTPLNATVKNGRITLDEPTDLPDGPCVLIALDDLLALGDTFQIVTSGPPRSFKKPKTIDAAALIEELRSY